MWNALRPKFPNVETDAFVVMPNHVHGILMFVGTAPRGHPATGQPHGVAPTVGDVVGWFKLRIAVPATLALCQRALSRYALAAMPYNPEAHHRRSIRLPGYDYTWPGAYFVTVCTQDRAILLERPDVQEAIAHWWNALPPKFPHLETDAFVVMPNHVHGVLLVGAAPRGRPSGGQPHGVAPTVGDVVGWFKTMTTNAYIRAVKDRAWPPFDRRLWQRNYYEHVIRNDDALNRIRQYILDNPARWRYDRDNPLGQPDSNETAFWETLGP